MYNVDVHISDTPDKFGQIPISYLADLQDFAFLYRVGFSLGNSLARKEYNVISNHSEELHWYHWLLTKSSSPRYLQALCRLEILGTLGHFRVTCKIERLPLPKQLKYFLSAEGVLEWTRNKYKPPADTEWDDSKYT